MMDIWWHFYICIYTNAQWISESKNSKYFVLTVSCHNHCQSWLLCFTVTSMSRSFFGGCEFKWPMDKKRGKRRQTELSEHVGYQSMYLVKNMQQPKNGIAKSVSQIHWWLTHLIPPHHLRLKFQLCV